MIVEKILLNNKKMCDILKTYDIIIPVPIHKKRMNIRGYNQSDLILKEIAKKIDKTTQDKIGPLANGIPGFM